MLKMHYFNNKYSKIAKRLEALRPQSPLTFNIDDLKFRNLAKLCGFYDEIKLQKYSYDVISVTSSPLSH